jgi:hypothetical protein
MDIKFNTVDEANNEVVDPPRKAKKGDKKKIVTGKTLSPPPQALNAQLQSKRDPGHPVLPRT